MEHIHGPGQGLTILRSPGAREYHLTATPLPGEQPTQTLQRLHAVLQEHEASVVRQEVFGACSLRGIVGDTDWPVTWIEGAGCGGSPLAGTHVLAIAGARVETVRLRDRAVGRTFTDAWGRHLVIGDLRPDVLTVTRGQQARQVYEDLEATLKAGGMNCAHIARTWLFLDQILDWYGEFNAVRTQFYRERGMFERTLPASTGIGASNPAGAGLVAGAWACEPAGEDRIRQEVPSPLQGPASSYGSSFSRAIELVAPGLRRILVSGTASIDHSGRTVHTGDLFDQIRMTMEVARAILQTRNLDFSDVTRATAYVKQSDFAPVFDDWREKHGLAHWPVITTQADICRDNLLFEIEFDAVA